MSEFKSHAEIIVALGGATAVARELGLGRTAVENMIERQRITADHWDGIIELAQQQGIKGITASVLLELMPKGGRGSKKKAAETTEGIAA